MLMFSMILVGNLHAAIGGVVKEVVDIDKSISLRSYDESFYISNNSRNEQKDQIAKISKQTDVRYSNPKASVVSVGTFKDNLERLANEQGFSPVIWDRRVKDCVWEQVQAYKIPETEPREILAFYASTLDFKPVFSDVDTHVQLIYFGPKTRIQHCEN